MSTTAPKKRTGDKPTESSKPEKKSINIKAVPMPSLRHHATITRLVTVGCVLVVVYFTSNRGGGREATFARQGEELRARAQRVDCSASYAREVAAFAGCAPERCGRFVADGLVSAAEAEALLAVAARGIALGGSDGGASVLDLHSGALSAGKKFVDVASLDAAKGLFDEADVAAYKVVKTKIQHAIGHNFGVDSDKLYLTYPTFFSRITPKAAATIHDEYWHPHVDKETYESFHYTSLLYLNDFGKDFRGGRFVFVDHDVNRTVEPRKARVSMFTSGAENLHFVEKVTEGTRYALTVSFTCDPNFDISESPLKIGT